MKTTYIRFCLYFCLIKNIFLTLLKIWCSFWSPEIIKIDFEVVVISAINKVFLDTVVTGCNFYLNESVWRQIQNIGLTVQYEKNNNSD
jgi:hypothetical protein